MSSATPTASGSASENIRVCARFRPLTRGEEGLPKLCVQFRDKDSVELLSEQETYPFTFSKVFSPSASQEEVYSDVGAPVIRDVLRGYNGCIFVYGQTGSGKTYTMMGGEMVNTSLVHASGGATSASPISPPQALLSSRHSAGPALPVFVPPVFHVQGPFSGIIPRAVVDLFDKIQQADADLEFEIKLFFVEIYMEHVRDLLNSERVHLNVREETATNSFYVDGCECPYVSSAQEVMAYVEEGLRNRTTAATKMNDISSRSHCLLGLTVKSVHSHRGETTIGKLYLVDLAGTEKVAKTKAEGQQLEEAKLINKSLTTLGLVIKNLSESKAQHIPYRDSKLTKILQDALGGNSRTTLIVCCSPSPLHFLETHSTLRFGARAKHIKNRAVVNKEQTVQELKHMLALAQAEIKRLLAGVEPAALSLPVRDEAEESAKQEAEAKVAELETYYQGQLSARDELLREAKLADDAARIQADRSNALILSLQEEVRIWEKEYSAALQEAAAQSKRLEKEKVVRAHDRALVEKLLESMLRTRNEVQWIRAACVDAMRGLTQEPALVGFPVDASGQQPQQHLDPCAAVAPATRVGGPQESSQQHSTSAEAAQQHAIAALQQRLHLIDRQYGELEASWKELMNENGTLMLENQLAEKKLAIRHDRIENLKQGLKQERQNLKDLQDSMEDERRVAKEKLLEARSDAEYWRHRYEALAQDFVVQSMHHHAKGAAGGLTPQNSRVVKHIRGGNTRMSPPSDRVGAVPISLE